MYKRVFNASSLKKVAGDPAEKLPGPEPTPPEKKPTPPPVPTPVVPSFDIKDLQEYIEDNISTINTLSEAFKANDMATIEQHRDNLGYLNNATMFHNNTEAINAFISVLTSKGVPSPLASGIVDFVLRKSAQVPAPVPAVEEEVALPTEAPDTGIVELFIQKNPEFIINPRQEDVDSQGDPITPLGRAMQNKAADGITNAFGSPQGRKQDQRFKFFIHNFNFIEDDIKQNIFNAFSKDPSAFGIPPEESGNINRPEELFAIAINKQAVANRIIAFLKSNYSDRLLPVLRQLVDSQDPSTVEWARTNIASLAYEQLKGRAGREQTTLQTPTGDEGRGGDILSLLDEGEFRLEQREYDQYDITDSRKLVNIFLQEYLSVVLESFEEWKQNVYDVLMASGDPRNALRAEMLQVYGKAVMDQFHKLISPQSGTIVAGDSKDKASLVYKNEDGVLSVPIQAINDLRDFIFSKKKQGEELPSLEDYIKAYIEDFKHKYTIGEDTAWLPDFRKWVKDGKLIEHFNQVGGLKERIREDARRGRATEQILEAHGQEIEQIFPGARQDPQQKTRAVQFINNTLSQNPEEIQRYWTKAGDKADPVGINNIKAQIMGDTPFYIAAMYNLMEQYGEDAIPLSIRQNFFQLVGIHKSYIDPLRTHAQAIPPWSTDGSSWYEVINKMLGNEEEFAGSRIARLFDHKSGKIKPSEMNRQREAVRNNPNLNPAQKREAIEQLEQEFDQYQEMFDEYRMWSDLKKKIGKIDTLLDRKTQSINKKVQRARGIDEQGNLILTPTQKRTYQKELEEKGELLGQKAQLDEKMERLQRKIQEFKEKGYDTDIFANTIKARLVYSMFLNTMENLNKLSAIKNSYNKIKVASSYSRYIDSMIIAEKKAFLDYRNYIMSI